MKKLRAFVCIFELRSFIHFVDWTSGRFLIGFAALSIVCLFANWNENSFARKKVESTENAIPRIAAAAVYRCVYNICRNGGCFFFLSFSFRRAAFSARCTRVFPTNTFNAAAGGGAAPLRARMRCKFNEALKAIEKIARNCARRESRD